MAIQLAYYSCHGKFGPTYETGHVRAFYHGRTDTVRTLSVESCAFVRAMIDASSDATARYAALRAACEAHGEQLQRVLTGQGIDRHLLGLYIASQMRGEAPAIFSDKARSTAETNRRNKSPRRITPAPPDPGVQTERRWRELCALDVERRLHRALRRICADGYRRVRWVTH